MTEPKQATSRQRSAFSDAVEILNELADLGIEPESVVDALDYTEQEFRRAHLYLTATYIVKLSEEETE